MYGHRHQRLVSESSTENVDNGICDERRHFQKRDECEKCTPNTFQTTLGYQTGHNGNNCLEPPTVHEPQRELNTIFQKPRQHLEERQKRLQNERDAFTRQLSNNDMSVTTNTEIPPSNQTVDNASKYTEVEKRNFGHSCTQTSGMYPRDDYANSHIKQYPLTFRTCGDNSHSEKSHEVYQQGEFHENHKPSSAPMFKAPEKVKGGHISCTCKNTSDAGGVGSACHIESETGKVDPRRYSKTEAEVINDKHSSRCEKKTEALGGRQMSFKVRDEYECQLQEILCHKAIKQKLDEDYAEIQKLRRNYSGLRKLFLALAILNIILILCVVSVMPVILVTFKLANKQDDPPNEDDGHVSSRELLSEAGKDIVKDNVFCVKCDRIKESSWSDIFTRKEHKRCCIEDVASLVERIMEKIKYENQRRDLPNAIFDPSLNGSQKVALLGGQFQKNSKLINKLLSRKRSAVHLSGKRMGHGLEWQQDFNTGQHLRRHGNDMIKVKNGGVYFVYSCVHFEAGLCNSNNGIGYHILMRRGKVELPVASAQHSCVNGTNTEQDLSLQQVVDIPVDTTSDISLHIRISSNHDLISKKHHHSFGLFEI